MSVLVQNKVTIVGSNTVSDLRKRIEELEAGAAVMREAFDRVWDIEEMGYTPDDPESEDTTCTCNKCEAVVPHGSHNYNCPQPIIEKALSTTAGADFLSRHKAMEVELADCKNSLHSLEHGKYGRNDYAQRLIESDGRLLQAHTALKAAVESMADELDQLNRSGRHHVEEKRVAVLQSALTLAKACGMEVKS